VLSLDKHISNIVYVHSAIAPESSRKKCNAPSFWGRGCQFHSFPPKLSILNHSMGEFSMLRVDSYRDFLSKCKAPNAMVFS